MDASILRIVCGALVEVFGVLIFFRRRSKVE